MSKDSSRQGAVIGRCFRATSKRNYIGGDSWRDGTFRAAMLILQAPTFLDTTTTLKNCKTLLQCVSSQLFSSLFLCCSQLCEKPKISAGRETQTNDILVPSPPGAPYQATGTGWRMADATQKTKTKARVGLLLLEKGPGPRLNVFFFLVLAA